LSFQGSYDFLRREQKVMTLPISKGQIKKAIQECLRQVEKAPRDRRLRLKLGDLYLKNGEKEKAVNEYLKAADLNAEEELNFRAIAIYKRVVSIDPKHIEAFRKIATLYSKDRLWGSAENCYEKILEIRPDDQEAIKALSMIRDSKQPKPDQPGLQTALPVRLGDSPLPGPTGEAKTPLPGEDLELHYHLGIGYKEMGLFDCAIAEFELVSKDPSREFDCYILLGECFKEKGDPEQSMKYFKCASKIRELPKEV
jgi:tetratricopeptide (TPR) repeat protein